MFALGLGAALVSSAMFYVGIVLQAVEAKRAPKSQSLRLSLIGSLLRRPRWVLGLVLGLVGIAPQVVALAYAPFVVVQPALAVGLLLVLVLGARMLDESVGPLELAGVVAIIGGIALIAWGAPSHTEQHRGGIAVIAVVAALGIGAVVPFAVRGSRLDTAMAVTIASGFGFAAGNIATKLFGDDAGSAHYWSAAAWAVSGLAMGVVATITNMTAFQRMPSTIVVPVLTGVQTFLPIVLEPFFLREHWGSAVADGIPIGAGLALALVGTVVLTRTRAVSDVVAAASR